MNKQEIQEGLKALINDISKYTWDANEEEIRSWLLAATMRIWAGNKLCAADYINVLPVFQNEEYTVAQVVTALDCAGEESREMIIPGFFKEIVQEDIKQDTANSRTTADAMGRFLVTLALVNGDFTLEEASALKGISDMLLGYCDEQDVKPGKDREYHPEMITPLNKSSYYLNPEETNEEVTEDTEKENRKTKRSVKRDPEAEEKKEENTEEKPPIIVNVNLTSDQGKEQNTGISVKKPADENAPEQTLEEVLAELNSLVGLDKVKYDVQSLLNFIKICQMRTERGMKVPTMSYHLVFTGNPGTGKTTVARMIAKLYYLIGILPQGQLIETDRSGLVAGYLGQTAIKTQKVIQEALGGVLFIDEAYSLANDKEDSYGKEAIETILKAMEDHRDELIVIVAGYDELMHQFIDSNPGLRSRFNKYFNFPDYTGDDLLKIFQRFCDTNGYTLTVDAQSNLHEAFNKMYESRTEHFGNARAIRNIFENVINQQANRLVSENDFTDEKLAELTLADIKSCLEV